MASLIPAIAATAAATAADMKISQRKTKTNTKKKGSSPKKPRKNSSGNKRVGKKSSKNRQRTRSGFGSAAVDPKELSAFRSIAADAIGILNSGNASSGGAVPVRRSMKLAGKSLSFEFSHLAQRDVDRQFRNGIRLVVTDIDGGTTAGIGTLNIRGGNSTQTTQPFADATAFTNLDIVDYTPLNMSDILSVVGEIFEAYAFRYSKFRYKPNVGGFTTNATAVNTNVSIALAFVKQGFSSAVPATSFPTIAQYEDHVTGHCTEAFEFDVCHTGTATWFNEAGSGAANFDRQGCLIGRFDSTPTLGADATHPGPVYGHIEACHIIDLYGVRQIDTSESDAPEKRSPSKIEIHRAKLSNLLAERKIADSHFDEKEYFLPDSSSVRSKSTPRVSSLSTSGVLKK